MADLYGEFDDSDDLEGNDDDIGALGSILSWDDDEDHAVRTPEPDVAGALGTGKSGGSSLPPGLVSFSLTKDANGQLYFPQLGGGNTNSVPNPSANNLLLSTNPAGTSTDQATSLALPLPTPINFAQEQQQQQPQAPPPQQAPPQQPQPHQQQHAPAPPQPQQQQPPQQPLPPQQAQPQQVVATQPAPAPPKQPQQQQFIQQGQPQQIAIAGLPPGLPANFAALFQQNAAALMQQQQPQQPQAQAKPPPPQQQPQQPPLAIRPAPPGMAGLVVQQVAPQQQPQAQQPIQPQQQQVQVQQIQQVQQVQQQPQMPGQPVPQAVPQVQQVQVQQQQQAQQQVQQQAAQQQVQQQLQQQAAQQFSITGDANAFLRQLQVAQIQQQFNAALQQQGGIPGALGAAQQQALQQQIQQLQRTQMPMVVAAPQAAPPQQPQPPQQVQQQQQQQPPPPQQPPAPQAAPAPPQQAAPPPPQPQQPQAPVPVAAASIPKAKAPTKPPATKTKATAASRKKAPQVVSASDTDGELSTRGGKKKAAASAADALVASSKKRKPPEPIDTSNMTPAERAKANRDRNREHARNTRLRKKAYLEKLKATVDELCKERDTLVSERAGAANLLVEMHNTRTEVLMSFFALRSTNEKRRKLWASILDESCFACVMPVTPYRSFPASEVQVSKCQRTVLGIDGMMADTASLHVLLSSLVDRSKFPHGKIEFCYTLVTEEAVVAGNQMMARWVMSTLNATQCGARMEVAKQGMLCCKFNSAHRITGLELMFDVMALMLQLKQAAGSESFSVIPNTVQTCQRSFDKPMVMTLAEGPYTIVQVNQLWENMTGYKAEEVVGKTSCKVLQGAMTDKASLQELMNEVRFKRAASVMLMNYTKAGERFRNFIVVFPLGTDSRITHYLALTSYVERLDGADVAADANNGSAIAQPAAVASTGAFNNAPPAMAPAAAIAPSPAMAPAAIAPAPTIAPAPNAAGQNYQLIQTQALQGNATTSPHQAALANAANAAMMAQAQTPMTITQAPGIPGQMLPPATTGMNVPQQQQQQQQQYAAQNVVQQQQQNLAPPPPQQQQQPQQTAIPQQAAADVNGTTPSQLAQV